MENQDEVINKLNQTIADYKKGQQTMQAILSSEIDLKNKYKTKLEKIEEICRYDVQQQEYSTETIDDILQIIESKENANK